MFPFNIYSSAVGVSPRRPTAEFKSNSDQRISMNKAELREILESVQNMLVARATGSSPNEADYNELRLILISEDLINGELPRFVRTCRSLSQFWAYISKESGTYAGRREHIWKGFAPLLEKLENNNSML